MESRGDNYICGNLKIDCEGIKMTIGGHYEYAT